MFFDGLWLDMNEFFNFCFGLNCYYFFDVVCLEVFDWCCMVCDNMNVLWWDRLLYCIINIWNKEFYEKIVIMIVCYYNDVKYYDVYNIYGFSQMVVIFKVFKEVKNW